MRNLDRIEPMINLILILWKKYPDMRFGQLVDNLYKFYSNSTGNYSSKDYFYIEDDDFYNWLINVEQFK